MKTEADDLRKIYSSFLKKHGYFQGWKSGVITWTRNSYWGEDKNSVGIEVSMEDDVGYLRIHYTQTERGTGEKKDFDYKIPLTSTPCRYGGRRYWFICPWYANGVYCGKRVGTLYKDGDHFACRHCYALTYCSRKVNRRYRMFPLFNVLDIEQKIEDLQMRIKHRYWRGRPTRLQRRLEKLYLQAGVSYRLYERNQGKKVV